ncbi:LysR family transcriptional regulator [Planosporangium thailandense]|uniref:LysR family transcriptional regulator n=1 Tax=Planosporangium thailandense TaxID=765197 RepID=A0ABX0Y6B9_9ACTN|nr:LysR family transcriptional regulator [Planosporangium thailandense]NJC73578.1 LysR family transcriptional regulator [Planosporangium thailandense]
MELEIRHLRVVHAIAEAGSITKAAASLGLSQPALTAQLQRLERMLGGELFHRGRSGAQPTPLGEVVLTRARAVLPILDDLHATVEKRRPTDPDPTTLRLGCLPAPLGSRLVVVVSDLLPDRKVSLHVYRSVEQVLQLLADGRMELAVVSDWPGAEITPAAGVDWATVAVEPLFVLLAAGHPLAAADEVDLADLADEEWLFDECEETGFLNQFQSACARAGFTPRYRQAMPPAVGLPLVALGHAVALAQPATPHPDLAVRPLAGTPLTARHVLVWPKRGCLARHVAHIRAGLAEEYRSLAAGSPVYAAWLAAHGELSEDAAGFTDR